jgi:carbamoyl-phosphate synthase / aspartate carbamoyltransferase
MTVNNPAEPLDLIQPALSELCLPNNFANLPVPSVAAAPVSHDVLVEPQEGLLELADGSAFRGISFGASGISVAGECVFQTGRLCAS